jgi:hypothetical protein
VRSRKEVTMAVKGDCSHIPFFRSAEWWCEWSILMVAVLASLGPLRQWCCGRSLAVVVVIEDEGEVGIQVKVFGSVVAWRCLPSCFEEEEKNVVV